jgi:phage terminase small subunit
MTARMPAGLRKEEQRAWREIVEEFGGNDVLQPSDRTLLRSMALLTARLEDIRSYLALGAGKKDPLGYLVAITARGFTSNPLISQERETIKELRLLHERMAKIHAGRGSARNDRPKNLSEMRKSLTAVKGGRAKASSG